MENLKSNRELKRDLKIELTKLVVSIILWPVGFVIGGYVIQQIWNTLIIKTFELVPLLLWQAVGIDMLITYITGYATFPEYYDFSLPKRYLFMAFHASLVLLVVRVIALFI